MIFSYHRRQRPVFRQVITTGTAGWFECWWPDTSTVTETLQFQFPVGFPERFTIPDPVPYRELCRIRAYTLRKNMRFRSRCAPLRRAQLPIGFSQIAPLPRSDC
jgi:hypothetical protein